MTQIKRQQTIFDLLRNFQGTEPLKELFWRELNYERINESLSRRPWTDTVSKVLADDPVLFASGGSDSAFHVIYARIASDTLFLGPERLVVNRLLKEHPYALFVVSNAGQDKWHFINVKYDEEEKKRKVFRRITIGPHERLRTAAERIALIDLEKIGGELFGIAPLVIQKAHDEAFDVEAVTEQFFEEYKATFNILQRDLARQTKDTHWAHDYSLQFLNRCMFLYFIQRKGWLNEDREFLRTFWETYWRSNRPDNSFVDEWLTILFFEAFNNKFHGGYRQFPSHIKEILQTAPYLNGGLFKKNRLDELHHFAITDQLFKQILTFLERYNFTIAEDSPLDQEVAVDPEMIGKVYESLVNVSEEATKRGDAGIFYTPRIEIDLMCRLSLVDCLVNHLGDNYKSLLYQFVFAIEEDDKENIDNTITKARLWESIQPLITDVTVLDPACGSGSFLVGMLNILNDLQERVQKKLKISEDVYERKKRIIGQSLYGVDVMEWACHVAELRLWLALIGDAEIEKHDLHVRNEPLLPHFSFKIRCGDSLVQEIGGLNLYHARDTRLIPQATKARITRLKTEKLKFYNNDPSCKFRTNDEITHEELNLFRDILETRQKKIQEEIVTLQRKIDGPKGELVRLDGSVEKQPRQLGLDAVTLQKQIDNLKQEYDQVTSSRDTLRTIKDIPFVWDIAFVEIFEGDKEGFDIVIGNPPYVRQENIAVPCMPQEAVTTENKKAYKGKLAASVYHAFPRFFRSGRKLDAKSDLYIYFYFHGLSLLNKKGSFCFITSNSWLDVGYGKDLQEFLLGHCHVKMVIDNQLKRSFASADVNTIIALFSAPDDRIDWASEKTAKFIMFKVPFESILSAVVFDEIEDVRERKDMIEYRVYPVRQEALLGDGCEIEEESQESEVRSQKSETPANMVMDKKRSGILIKSAKYIGNKWGGKYLRAPDIYWTILEKGKNYISQLSTYVEGERYLNTGGADGFFILNQVEKIGSGLCHIINNSITDTGNSPFDGEIEKKYLVPLIKDYTKQNKRIDIEDYDAYCVVIREKPGIRLQKYLKWGEKQGYHKRSVTKNQHPWYKPTNQMTSSAKILVPRSFNDTYIVHHNKNSFLSLRFYRLHPKNSEGEEQLIVYLNSTLVWLFVEVLANKSLGLGVLDFFMADFLSMRIPIILNEDLVSDSFKKRILCNVWEEFGVDAASVTPQIKPVSDRRTIDDAIFDTIRLTADERDAVYEAVINLVESRLKKAGSV